MAQACHRRHLATACLLGGLGSTACSGAIADEDTWRPAPDAAFVQLGLANGAQTLTAGASWDLPLQRPLAGGRLGSYMEASVGRWQSRVGAGGRSSAWVTQIGVTPVLRWHPAAWGGRWFVEAGIGLNVLFPIYRSGDKRFSTTFNFGDHLGVGRHLGPGAAQELSLRIQHYSNAGIKRPNPGEDFLQLRYVWRY